MASVTLKNVSKKYSSDIVAVDDFNLEINDGEIIVFVGPSGCGKSTTLRMIAGLENITSGELYINGKLMTNAEPKDRGLAMVFQNYALFPHMTVFENIAFGLKPYEFTEAETKARVEEIAKIGNLDVIHLLDRMPNTLSNGQRQRVALARAFVREHDVILLDEPLSHVDAKLRSVMRVEIMKLHKKFKSTHIYVTHHQEEAMSIADRIVVMHNGIIKQVGPPEELYAHPNCLFVAGFLGTPQMNFEDTVVTEKDGEIFVDFMGSKMKLPKCKAEKAIDYVGKEVIVGIRPEDIHADEMNITKFKDYVADTTVQVREFLGERTYLYSAKTANIPHGQITTTIRVSSDCPAKSGDKIKVAVNPDKIHLFDKDTEATIVN